MGSELFAHFSIERQRIESEELAELAEDAGSKDLPTTEEQDRVIARLDADSKVREVHEAELMLDVSKLHFFDPDSGRSVTSREQEPALAES